MRHYSLWGIVAALLFISRAGFSLGFSISGGTVTLADAAKLSTVSDLAIHSGSLAVHNSQIAVGGSWMNSGGSFLPGTSTVTLNSSASGKTITSNGSSFYNLYFNGSGGYWTLQDSMTVLSTMTLTAGTLDTNSGGGYPMSVSGGWLNNGGNFTVNGSTLTLTGNSAQVVRNAGQPFAVIVDSNSSSDGVVFASSFTATGLTINSAGLAKPTTAYFNAGSTYTIAGLTLIGSSGKMVWMRSTSDNQAWYLHNSTNNVAYVDVKDSNANGGTTIAAGARSIDSGNNPNWTFLILSISLSTHSYDYGAVAMSSVAVSTTAITVMNTGNDTETYGLSIATSGPTTVWSVGASTPTSYNTFVMFAGFNSVMPSSNTFTAQDVLTKTGAASTTGIYAMDQTGVSVPAGNDRQLWLRLDMPPKTSTVKPQQMDLTIMATNP